MQPVVHVSQGGEAVLSITHTQMGKMKLPAIPCITPCVNIKCHSFVLKAIPTIVRTQRMEPIPIIGLYLLRDPS